MPPLMTPVLALVTGALAPALQHPPALERRPDGIVLAAADGILKLEVWADDAIRVAFARDPRFFERRSLALQPQRRRTPRFDLAVGPAEATLTTAKLIVGVELASGAVSFRDRRGQPLLLERRGARTLTPADVQGDRAFHVRQEWEGGADEALYGLGQHQLGLMNVKGYDLDLHQFNTSVAVPFLVSSRGYGILWDNTSLTRFGDLRRPEPIPANRLYDASGRPGGLTASYHAGSNFERLVATRVEPTIDVTTPDRKPKPNTRLHPDLPPQGDVSVRWEGEVLAEVAGDHTLHTYSNSELKVFVDDRLVIDHWRQGWLPWIDVARVRMEANRRHRLRVEWRRDQGEDTVRLLWKTPSAPATSMWSEVGDGIDYYLVYGPELDQVVAGYRRLTGEAPMMPVWAFGLWQCRERYKTEQESLEVLDGFRSRGIPVDNIVQDWFYWKEDQWGSHEFDPGRFPDPEGWIRAIHDKYKARIMLSVWPKFYSGTQNFEALRSRGFLFEPNLAEGLRDWVGYPYTFYDAFDPEARRLFWSQVERTLWKKGVDAWWMDATEPELVHGPILDNLKTHMHPTALGTGASMLNAYSLVNSQAVYEGQRAAAPERRVFILTRSGFAGTQRYASATWSGDITSTWTAFRKQIPAGLSFQLSGIPYWTTDIGGFAVPRRFSRQNPTPEDVEEWRELNTRWFQFGAFCPLFRVHGQFPFREMWHFGGESHPAYQTQLKFDRLRYRLLPYVYSLAGAVTQEASTIMRALVMDFRGDRRALDVGDQFMFGPAMLVSPVTAYRARSRSVYLPQAAGWYDFWTGGALAGGQQLDAPAPYESMPIHVRAGSILPVGPELQRTAEKPADPITLFVYAGADGAFTLYEDDGVSYAYESGGFARIPLRWNDARRTLTIGKRAGSFEGMLAQRTFEVVFVSRQKPVGFSFTPKPDRTVRYRGDAVEVSLR